MSLIPIELAKPFYEAVMEQQHRIDSMSFRYMDDETVQRWALDVMVCNSLIDDHVEAIETWMKENTPPPHVHTPPAGA